jgi:hypothetical protein
MLAELMRGPLPVGTRYHLGTGIRYTVIEDYGNSFRYRDSAGEEGWGQWDTFKYRYVVTLGDGDPNVG